MWDSETSPYPVDQACSDCMCIGGDAVGTCNYYEVRHLGDVGQIVGWCGLLQARLKNLECLYCDHREWVYLAWNRCVLETWVERRQRWIKERWIHESKKSKPSSSLQSQYQIYPMAQIDTDRTPKKESSSSNNTRIHSPLSVWSPYTASAFGFVVPLVPDRLWNPKM